HGDLAAHAADELAADVETEPGAADAAGQLRIDAVELAEDPPLLERRDPDSLVADGQPHAAVAPRHRDPHPAAGGGIFDRVVDKVEQHLPELVRIRGNWLEPGGHGALERDVVPVRERDAHLLDDTVREGAEVDRLLAERELAR